MIETREKIIEGSNYSVTQLPARKALRLKTKLIKCFGPMLAQLFLTVSDGESESDKKISLVHAIEILSQSIDENTFENLVMELLQGVRKNGVELNQATFDLEFAGNFKELYLVLFFVIEVNFSSFFSLIGIGNPFEESIQTPLKTDSKRTYTRR